MRNERSQILLFGFGKAHDELAGRIVVLGYRALRANDVESVLDLLRRPGQPIRVFVFPVGAPFPQRESDLRSLTDASSTFGLRLIVSGDRPSPPEIAALKREGVRFGLWKPFHDSELRFVLNSALYDETRGQLRPNPRVPASLVVRMKSGAGEKAGMLYNLSMTGAFIETPRPNMAGGRITLMIEFPDGTLAIPASVVFSNVPGNLQRPNLPLGMGAKFVDVNPQHAERIAKYVAERTRAYDL